MASKKKSFPDVTENERKLLDKVPIASVEEVKALLQEKDVKVDCLDKSGMTPLQHAAFRNKLETAELLLAHGADVNSNEHENGYTALMFAALSGNAALTRLMLTHGAKKDRINSVGRNSAQMAAFVGQHQCVAVINNYYDKSDLEYYTIKQGQEEEPKLPPVLLPALLKMMNMSNMHPVKISLHLQQHKELMDESYKVCKVLDLITEKSMKARDTDDVMAMKSHYFATLIRKAKDVGDIDTWIKDLLKGRPEDSYPELQDQVIRQSLKEFPFVESQLLLNMVRQLSTTKIGDDPSSLNILMQGVNGQKFGFGDDVDCATCGEPKAEKKCSKCKLEYCDRKCQELHWPTHKKLCKKQAEEYIRREKIRDANKKREEAAEKMREEEKRVIEEEKAYALKEQEEAQEEREEALKEKEEAEIEREEAKQERLEAVEERKEAEIEREEVQKEKREAELERIEAEDEKFDAEEERLEAEEERRKMEEERKGGGEVKKEGESTQQAKEDGNVPSS